MFGFIRFTYLQKFGLVYLTLERGILRSSGPCYISSWIWYFISLFQSSLSLSKTLQNSRSGASLSRSHLLSLISPNPLGFRPKFFTKVGYHLEGFIVCGEDRVSTSLILGVLSHFFFKTWGKDFLRVIYMFLQDLDDFRNHPLISFDYLIVDFMKMSDFERVFNFFSF